MKKVVYIFLFALLPSIFGSDAHATLQDNESPIEIIVSNDIMLYPNPAKSFVQVESSTKEAIQEIGVYDLLGNTVLTIKGNQKQKVKFNVQNLRNGRYTVRVVFLNGKAGFTHLVKV